MKKIYRKQNQTEKNTSDQKKLKKMYKKKQNNKFINEE